MEIDLCAKVTRWRFVSRSSVLHNLPRSHDVEYVRVELQQRPTEIKYVHECAKVKYGQNCACVKVKRCGMCTGGKKCTKVISGRTCTYVPRSTTVEQKFTLMY